MADEGGRQGHDDHGAPDLNDRVPQEQPVDRVGRLLGIRVPQGLERSVQRGVIRGGHLQSHQDASVVGALIAVMEQADVPGRVQR